MQKRKLIKILDLTNLWENLVARYPVSMVARHTPSYSAMFEDIIITLLKDLYKTGSYKLLKNNAFIPKKVLTKKKKRVIITKKAKAKNKKT